MGIVDLLKPISAGFYGLGVGTRRWAYDRGLLGTTFPSVQTISVGGLEAGGTGKTPVARLVLGALAKGGKRPGLLTRGYRRQSEGLVVREVGGPAEPAVLGDEAAMIAQELDLPVATCADRLRGAQALEGLGCDALVLDDAFAHRRIGRHVDVVVLCGESPLGNGHLLPWGMLRESPKALARAHVVWLHYRRDVEPPRDVPPALRALAPQAHWVVSTAQPHGPMDFAESPHSLGGTPVVACAGLARPKDFLNSLRGLGAQLVGERLYEDHWAYSTKDVEALRALRDRCGARAVVTTPKDAVKLRALVGPEERDRWWTVGYQVRIEAGAEGLAELLEVPPSFLGP